jgi:hypothetical protein
VRTYHPLWWGCQTCEFKTLRPKPPEVCPKCAGLSFVRIRGIGWAPGRKLEMRDGTRYITQKDGSLRRVE